MTQPVDVLQKGWIFTVSHLLVQQRGGEKWSMKKQETGTWKAWKEMSDQCCVVDSLLYVLILQQYTQRKHATSSILPPVFCKFQKKISDCTVFL